MCVGWRVGRGREGERNKGEGRGTDRSVSQLVVSRRTTVRVRFGSPFS